MKAAALLSLGVHGAFLAMLAANPSQTAEHRAALSAPPESVPLVASAPMEITLVTAHSPLAAKPKHRVLAPTLADEDKGEHRHGARRARPIPSLDGSALAAFSRLAAGLDTGLSPAPAKKSNKNNDLTFHGPRLGPIARGIMTPVVPSFAKKGQPADPHGWSPSGRGTYTKMRKGFDTAIARDGSVTFTDKNFEGNPLSAMSFDVTDMAMRAAGMDPYLKEKLDFLDSTRERRAEMARQDRGQRLQVVVAEIPDRLVALWARTDLSVAAKKRLLFELWDECSEVGATPVVVAATRVRRRIETFIRRTLPRASAHQFSEAELAELNRRRRSRQRFAPYD